MAIHGGGTPSRLFGAPDGNGVPFGTRSLDRGLISTTCSIGCRPIRSSGLKNPHMTLTRRIDTISGKQGNRHRSKV